MRELYPEKGVKPRPLGCLIPAAVLHEQESHPLDDHLLEGPSKGIGDRSPPGVGIIERDGSRDKHSCVEEIRASRCPHEGDVGREHHLSEETSEGADRIDWWRG